MPKFSYDGSPFEFSPWKKTSGKENLGGAVGSPRPEAEARPNRRCWDYAAIHTWFLVLSWTLAGWRDLTTDRFPGECIGRKSAIWEIWVGEIWSLSLPDYFQFFFSSAFICYSISKNPRLSMEQPLQFRILYTNCLWSSNLFWLIQTHGTKTRHRYTHNSCTYLEISWFSIGRMEEARPHMPYTQTHTCITVVLYLDIIQKSHVYDLCGCFFLMFEHITHIWKITWLTNILQVAWSHQVHVPLLHFHPVPW